MPTDLTTSGLLHRTSVLVRDNELVLLEHQFTKDRLRRIAYDRVEAVLCWRTMPWVRMMLFLIGLGTPGILLVIYEPSVMLIGWLLISMAVLIVLRYLYLGKSLIRITRAGNDYHLEGIVSPRKLKRCLARLESAIHRFQAEAAATAKEHQIAIPIDSEEPESDTMSML